MFQKYSFILLAIVLIISFTACETTPTRDTVRLKSRDIVIDQEAISEDFLTQLKITRQPRLHAFVQLRQRPSIATRKELEGKGVTLLFHLEPRFWVAAVAKDFSPVDKVVRAHVRWLAEIKPTDKISPDIRAGKLRDWAVQRDGQIKVAVTFFKDVPPEKATEILEAHTKQIQPWPMGNSWYVTVRRDAIEVLAAHDQVKWIEQGPVPFQPFIIEIRDLTYTNEVQSIDLNQGSTPPFYNGPTGAGVQIGFWDTGIHALHEDFIDHWDENGDPIWKSRIVNLTTANNTDLNGHGTNVAGVLGASGYRSNLCHPYPPPYSYAASRPRFSS